jgi:hypothetical protein
MENPKTLFLLILLISPWFGHSQIEYKSIPPQFDAYEFYPDSTLKTVYQTKNNLVHGWAIEFNQNGEATGIGKYRKNAKRGEWRYSDCSIIRYKKNCDKVYSAPYCGMLTFSLRIKFDALVSKQLKPKI